MIDPAYVKGPSASDLAMRARKARALGQSHVAAREPGAKQCQAISSDGRLRCYLDADHVAEEDAKPLHLWAMRSVAHDWWSRPRYVFIEHATNGNGRK